MAVSLSCTPLLATRVKLLVSVQSAFSLMNVAVFTFVSFFKDVDPLYQEMFEDGLLSISRVNSILSDSFTMVVGFLSIAGLSGFVYKKEMPYLVKKKLINIYTY